MNRRVWVLGFWFWGLGSGYKVLILGFGIQGLGIRV